MGQQRTVRWWGYAMQISLAKLRSLSETDFRRQVLAPLLRAMDFRDVTELHGSNERGKDIVMWKSDAFRTRENYALVAKVCRVTQGRASTDVVRQIRECLGSPYRDPITLQEMSVSRVIVVTSRVFTVPAKNSILAELRSSGSTNVAVADFLDGESLLELIKRYMPTALIWDSLTQASKELNSLSENYSFFLKVGPTGPSVQVASRHDEAHLAEPIKGSLTVAFPDTPEGMKKRLEYQEWSEHGTPVTLSPENIAQFETPQLVRDLAADGEITWVTLAPASLVEPLLRRILVVDERGTELFALDYVHFTHVQGGSKSVTIDNRGQPIPFRVSLVFDKETKHEILSCSFETRGATNVTHYLRWMQSSVAVATGGRLILQDWNSRLPILEVRTDSLRMEAFSSKQVAIIEKMTFIQAMSGVQISLQDDVAITNEDAENTHFAWTVMQQGIAEIPNASIAFTTKDASPWKDQVGKDVAFTIEKDFEVVICGATIQLGTAQVLCRGVPMVVAGSDTGVLTIDASDGLPFVVAFPQWLARKSARDPDGNSKG
jgi:hypothetical protein